jgi:hypothetical protein
MILSKMDFIPISTIWSNEIDFNTAHLSQEHWWLNTKVIFEFHREKNFIGKISFGSGPNGLKKLLDHARWAGSGHSFVVRFERWYKSSIVFSVRNHWRAFQIPPPPQNKRPWPYTVSRHIATFWVAFYWGSIFGQLLTKKFFKWIIN